MNCAGRKKGWEAVERRVSDWLSNFRRHNIHSIDLQSDLACKVSPLASIPSYLTEVCVSNVFNPTQPYACQPPAFSNSQIAPISERFNNSCEVAGSLRSSSTLPPSDSQVAGSMNPEVLLNFDQLQSWDDQSSYEWEIMNSPDSWSTA